MFYHCGCSRSKGIPKANPETPKGKAQGSGSQACGTDGNIHQKAGQMSVPEHRLVPRHFVCSGWGLEGVS